MRALHPEPSRSATDGTIGVAYYDFRSNTPDPATLLTDYWLATSSDGVHLDRAALAGPFDYAKAPLVGGRYFLGDYMGIAASGTTFLPLFAQATANANNRSDILAGLAPPHAPAGNAPGARRCATVRRPGTPPPSAAAAGRRVDRGAVRAPPDA